MKYSKGLTKEICDNLRLGHTIEDACVLSGISKDTFYRWLKKKSDFSDAIKKAEIECKRAHIANIRRAAMGIRVLIDPKDPEKGYKFTKDPIWQASAWWLERRYKEEFSTKQEVELTDRKELNKIEEELRNLANNNEKKH